MDVRPTERFSDRVADYKRCRPSYPPGVLDLLIREFRLSTESVVADVGSGTGIWTKSLLESGATILAVEPNREMREAAEADHAANSQFRSVDGTAEATTLPDQSVDMITVAQAFHWFRQDEAIREFGRILKPRAPVVLIWNDRTIGGSAFLTGYEQLLISHAPEYEKVRHRYISGSGLRRFFESMTEALFSNEQKFDLDGLIGRMLSSSYVPAPGTAGFEEVMEAARRLFLETAEEGFVTFRYETQVFFGPPTF